MLFVGAGKVFGVGIPCHLAYLIDFVFDTVQQLVGFFHTLAREVIGKGHARGFQEQAAHRGRAAAHLLGHRDERGVFQILGNGLLHLLYQVFIIALCGSIPERRAVLCVQFPAHGAEHLEDLAVYGCR